MPEKNEAMALLKSLHTTPADIYEDLDPRSKVPLQDSATARERATLRSLARNCHVGRALHSTDSEEYRTAIQALDVATLQMRSRIGVEVTRPEFLPIGVCA